MQRLGKNLTAYAGEIIDIQSVLHEFAAAAGQHGWQLEQIPGGPAPWFLACKRLSPKPGKKIYLSTGIHGDEPAGPLALLRLLQQNRWPAAEYWLCPCLNPTGFPRNTRENAQGIDLNRDYRQPRTSEVRAHVAWLQCQPQFDLTLLLHEDWEAAGFYVYELNPDRQASLAEGMVARVAQVCPIDPATEIEGRAARDGIIRPEMKVLERPDWPEAFYLIAHQTRLSYTLEAPSDFPLSVRVDALVTAVETALAEFRQREVGPH